MLKKIFVVVSALLICQLASAEDSYNDLLDFFEKTQINGDIRSYYFTRDYSNPDAVDQSAYSLGGNIRILTAPLFGFQVGAAYYTAQSLGLNSKNQAEVDRTLPGNDIGVLGQLYIQYKGGPIFLRVGDQLINTPWMPAGDSRIIPATYQGVYGVWTPDQNWTFTGLRMIAFKSRVADSFSETNLYNPDNFGTAIPKLDDTTDQGAWGIGANYNSGPFNSETWGLSISRFWQINL